MPTYGREPNHLTDSPNKKILITQSKPTPLPLTHSPYIFLHLKIIS